MRLLLVSLITPCPKTNYTVTHILSELTEVYMHEQVPTKYNTKDRCTFVTFQKNELLCLPSFTR